MSNFSDLKAGFFAFDDIICLISTNEDDSESHWEVVSSSIIQIDRTMQLSHQCGKIVQKQKSCHRQKREFISDLIDNYVL